MSHKNFVKKYLSDESLDRIAESIGEIEKKTSGELRVCIKKKKGLLEKNKPSRELAHKEFLKLNMHKTRDRTGVLLLIIFEDREFEIIADAGINEKIGEDLWSNISSKMKEHFSKEEYLEGIQFALGRIGEVLIREFKVKDNDTDELSNEVIIG
ncbi:MAG: TPM domain-containing protein [Ignavibacteriae bacterium]|nr:TPM domain-containing protein [Ignavibacteriota bacterium]